MPRNCNARESFQFSEILYFLENNPLCGRQRSIPGCFSVTFALLDLWSQRNRETTSGYVPRYIKPILGLKRSVLYFTRVSFFSEQLQPIPDLILTVCDLLPCRLFFQDKFANNKLSHLRCPKFTCSRSVCVLRNFIIGFNILIFVRYVLKNLTIRHEILKVIII